MHDKRVKDKRIYPGTVLFTAVVEFFQDTPARDGDEPIEEVFDTFVLAQKFLATFPRDVWDGYDTSDFNYQEVDEDRNGRSSSRKATRNRKRHRPEQRGMPEIGRSFARIGV
jgi:hypothetical protein